MYVASAGESSETASSNELHQSRVISGTSQRNCQDAVSLGLSHGLFAWLRQPASRSDECAPRSGRRALR